MSGPKDSRAIREMVAILSEAGAPVSRSDIARRLWPGATHEQALANLRQTLRRSASPEIEVRRDSLVLADGHDRPNAADAMALAALAVMADRPTVALRWLAEAPDLFEGANPDSMAAIATALRAHTPKHDPNYGWALALAGLAGQFLEETATADAPFEAAYAYARRLGDRRLFIWTAFYYCANLIVQGRLDSALRIAEVLFRQNPCCRTLHARALARTHAGDFERGMADFRRAVELGKAEGLRFEWVYAGANLAWCASPFGEEAGIDDLAREPEAKYLRFDLTLRLARARRMVACDPHEALVLAEDVDRIAARYGTDPYRAYAADVQSLALRRLGDEKRSQVCRIEANRIREGIGFRRTPWDDRMAEL